MRSSGVGELCLIVVSFPNSYLVVTMLRGARNVYLHINISATRVLLYECARTIISCFVVHVYKEQIGD